ncbi:hypothetical protein BDW02DRAFT_243809 [Decorospora gaudefroyi]|uniref:Uncharacterized protein n=1 Tax=Decorospora gaudefroyi TaxID=184978 RepID=A0A6A5K2E1_9PLEO|nr:hypothetical protein BDW02DRAFT_243809 [Decorospora gaudefroyi]
MCGYARVRVAVRWGTTAQVSSRKEGERWALGRSGRGWWLMPQGKAGRSRQHRSPPASSTPANRMAAWGRGSNHRVSFTTTYLSRGRDARGVLSTANTFALALRSRTGRLLARSRTPSSNSGRRRQTASPITAPYCADRRRPSDRRYVCFSVAFPSLAVMYPVQSPPSLVSPWLPGPERWAQAPMLSSGFHPHPAHAASGVDGHIFHGTRSHHGIFSATDSHQTTD